MPRINLQAFASLFMIVLLIVLICLVALFAGCKTYEPVPWNDKLPPQCNMALNTYKLYYSSPDKSATVPDATYCYKALHREECRLEVYGDAPVDYNDATKYRNYTQCLAELR